MTSGKLQASLLISVLIVLTVIVFPVLSLRVDDNNNAACTNGTRVTSTLQFVVVVTRHGKRGPCVSFSKCPYPKDDRTYWPYGADKLTNPGRVQMYHLGLTFRSMYNGFLSQLYLPEEFKVLSSVSSRTMMSAAQISAGLFPPTGFQIWSDDIAWQPIPIFPDDKDQSLVLGPDTCPKYQEERQKSWENCEQVYGANMTRLINSVQPYTGISAGSGLSLFFNLMTLFECLYFSDENGYPLPNWSQTVYPEPLTTLWTIAQRASGLGSVTMVRLAEGLLFQEIVSLIQAKVNGCLLPDRKMVIFNNHDITIMGLQDMLGLPGSERTIVRTGSALIYELHRDLETNEHYVEILYIDGGMTDPEPVIVNIPSCPFPCDFNTLRTVTEKYYNITDYDKECEATNSTVTG